MQLTCTVDDRYTPVLTAFASEHGAATAVDAASGILTTFLENYRQSLQSRQAVAVQQLEPEDVLLLQAINDATPEQQEAVRQAVRQVLRR